MNRMKRRSLELAGVSFVEMIVVCILAVPLLSISYNALIGARRAESATAIGAAIRGASVFERYIRRDLASIDFSQGALACTTTEDSINMELALPQSIPGLPLMKKVSRLYKLEPATAEDPPKAYNVYRDGRRLTGVMVESMHASIVGTGVDAWVQVDLRTLDIGLTRNKQGHYVGHSTTILAPLPPAFNPTFLLDYSLWPPQ